MRPPYGDIGVFLMPIRVDPKLLRFGQMTVFALSPWQWAWFLFCGLHPPVINSTRTTGGLPGVVSTVQRLLTLSKLFWGMHPPLTLGEYCFVVGRQVSHKLPSFIVLQHDLFEITVDLAVGYTLDAALSHDPKFSVRFYQVLVCINCPHILFHSSVASCWSMHEITNDQSVLGEQREYILPKSR